MGLTEDGVLFCFGANGSGQCGVGQSKGREAIRVPTKVEMNDKIAFVVCGTYHTLIISRKGLIYLFGSGDGRLGHGTHHNKWIPTLIERLNRQKNETMRSRHKAFTLCG